jgi:hypothetical protein
MLVSKHLGDLLDHLRYQCICLLDYKARFVHKLALDLIPARAKMLWFLSISLSQRLPLVRGVPRTETGNKSLPALILPYLPGVARF